MNCIKVQNLLSAYIDQECTEQERIFIKAHLEGCPDCLEEFNMIESVVNMTHHIDEVELPEGFHSDLMNRIRGQFDQVPTKKPFYKRIYGTSIVAAALLFCVVFGIMGTSVLFNMVNINKSTDSENISEDISNSNMENNLLADITEKEVAKQEAPKEESASEPIIIEESANSSLSVESNTGTESIQMDSNVETKNTQVNLDTTNKSTQMDSNPSNKSTETDSNPTEENTEIDLYAADVNENDNNTSSDAIDSKIIDKANIKSDTFAKSLKFIALLVLVMIFIPIMIKFFKKNRK